MILIGVDPFVFNCEYKIHNNSYRKSNPGLLTKEHRLEAIETKLKKEYGSDFKKIGSDSD